jgi:HEAT repeat protein
MKHARFLLAVLFALPVYADLARDVASVDGWSGYSVPSAQRTHVGDCDDWHAHEFDSDTLFVKLHVEGGRVDRIRLQSAECAHTGEAVRWLHDVDPKESIRFLASLTGDLRKHALDAIAMHADESATPYLERIARGGVDDDLREQAVFWLGAVRGRAGYEIVRELTRNTSEPRRLREKGVFAMMQSREKEKVDDVIAIAQHDPEPHVRSQALFWLSQEAGHRAAGALRNAVDNDPNEEVKAKAVFGIAQLPNDESIPLLVDLMKNNRSREVRRKAAFWLGQKNDRRAVEAIAEYLQH